MYEAFKETGAYETVNPEQNLPRIGISLGQGFRLPLAMELACRRWEDNSKAISHRPQGVRGTQMTAGVHVKITALSKQASISFPGIYRDIPLASIFIMYSFLRRISRRNKSPSEAVHVPPGKEKTNP